MKLRRLRIRILEILSFRDVFKCLLNPGRHEKELDSLIGKIGNSNHHSTWSTFPISPARVDDFWTPLSCKSNYRSCHFRNLGEFLMSLLHLVSSSFLLHCNVHPATLFALNIAQNVLFPCVSLQGVPSAPGFNGPSWCLVALSNMPNSHLTAEFGRQCTCNTKDQTQVNLGGRPDESPCI